MSTYNTIQEVHQPMLTGVSAVTRREYPSHPSSPYTDALQQWKSVRTRLGTVIQEYLDACTTLKDVCAQPPSSPSDERWPDPVLVAVDSELPSIVSDENKMFEARKQLVIARNYSSSLVPINRLPPEVLVQIFEHVLALNGCYVQDPPRTKPSEPRVDEYTRTCSSFHSTTLDVISGVSTHWRQLAINTPMFWAHLDFNLCDDASRDRGVVRTDYFISRAELWIARTRGCPLSVHIFDHGVMTDDNPYYKVLRFLIKHVSRIAILTLEVQETYLIQMILSGLLCRGSPSSLETLVCKFPGEYKPARSIEPLYETPRNDEVPSTSVLDWFLLSLHTLHLTNGLAQWSGLACSGLVDLRIWGENFSEDEAPTTAQLEGIFRASPRLRILKLGAMKIRGPAAPSLVTRTAVTLNYLEVLDLAWMGSSSLGLLLPMIIPGKRPLTMSAKVFHDQTGAVSALRRFFGMAKIVRLQMIGRTGWHTVFSQLYSHLPDLEVLALDNQHTNWNAPNINSFDLPKPRSPSTPPSAHYPRLDVLYLRGSGVDSTWLRRLLANHSVRELHLDCVNLASRKIPFPSKDWEDTQIASLKQLVPCVKVTNRSANRDDVVSMCDFAW